MKTSAGKIALRRLNTKPGDIVTVTFPVGFPDAKASTIMNSLVPVAVQYQLTLLGLAQGIQIATLDEHQMNQLGWYRK